MSGPLKAVGCGMNWADIEKPLGVGVGAESANKGYPLGQFIIALWRMQRDFISRLWLVSIILYNTATSWHIFHKFFFTNDGHAQRDIPFSHEWSCHFLPDFGLDDKMTSRTAWGLWFEKWWTLVHEHASKKRTSIWNFELKFDRRNYWPSKVTKSKKQEKVKISSQ